MKVLHIIINDERPTSNAEHPTSNEGSGHFYNGDGSCVGARRAASLTCVTNRIELIKQTIQTHPRQTTWAI